jgi:hypothetical protein
VHQSSHDEDEEFQSSQLELDEDQSSKLDEDQSSKLDEVLVEVSS